MGNLSQLARKAEQHDDNSDSEKNYPSGANENHNGDENAGEKWYQLGGEEEQYNNKEADEDYNNELLKTVKTIHITSYEDVLGDIDVCRFDTLRDMRKIMETTWDGEDLYWPAGFRFYVDGEKIERDDEETWSVMKLPMVVDVKINEDYSRGSSWGCEISVSHEDQHNEKRLRDDKDKDNTGSNIETSPMKKKKSSNNDDATTNNEVSEKV